ncbi:hypothetical protein CMI45_02660 [Candidatus Pacearchaeota archaeon]|jgi:hypothetical protein|nr:hypothetical protein [Candidatus Pacearchaeota archaeon]|tara:strand:- start:654 stop:863 length:210 start_codon:yes stop_codon:yes gene_type:complete
MSCNCKTTESILAILIIVFAFWETSYSMWVVVIAAALILIHALKCGRCYSCGGDMKGGKVSGKVKKRKK